MYMINKQPKVKKRHVEVALKNRIFTKMWMANSVCFMVWWLT